MINSDIIITKEIKFLKLMNLSDLGYIYINVHEIVTIKDSLEPNRNGTYVKLKNGSTETVANRASDIINILTT